MPIPPHRTGTLFGLRFNAVSFREAVDLLCEQIPLRPAKVVVTPNVDHLLSLADDPDLRAIYNTADFKFVDGMPLVWASRWLGVSLPERVTGADLFVALCQQAQARHWRVSILGGLPGQEAMLTQRFQDVFPGLQVAIQSPAMGFDYRSDEAVEAVNRVNAFAPDLVFVCLGFPRQSLWSITHRHRLDTGLVLCVGAAMEFALGFKTRAPRWMQVSGLEWLWRLGSDPRKLWRRYLLRGPRFIALVWREWKSSLKAGL
jgi:N-acetylglucosaminyldiphosphoundecaprenol N-acetyl-beta-D-mannosaminyltransferase